MIKYRAERTELDPIIEGLCSSAASLMLMIDFLLEGGPPDHEFLGYTAALPAAMILASEGDIDLG